MADGDPTPNPETPPATPPATPTAWHEGYDQDTLGWLNNRGYDALPAADATAQLIKGFRNMESTLGVPQDQILKLPADLKAEGALDAVFARLGRPDEAGKYELNVGETDTQGVSDWARETFHKLGLTQDQAAGVYDSLGEFIGGIAEKEANDLTIKQAANAEELKKEWGNTYDANISRAKAAAAKLGVSPEDVAALEETVGYTAVMKMFQKIGVATGEDSFVGGDHNFGPGYPTTPEGAKARIAELKNDKAFTKRYLDNESEANNMMTNLHVIAASGRT
jgi:hypothetical protein